MSRMARSCIIDYFLSKATFFLNVCVQRASFFSFSFFVGICCYPWILSVQEGKKKEKKNCNRKNKQAHSTTQKIQKMKFIFTPFPLSHLLHLIQNTPLHHPPSHLPPHPSNPRKEVFFDTLLNTTQKIPFGNSISLSLFLRYCQERAVVLPINFFFCAFHPVIWHCGSVWRCINNYHFAFLTVL